MSISGSERNLLKTLFHPDRKNQEPEPTSKDDKPVQGGTSLEEVKVGGASVFQSRGTKGSPADVPMRNMSALQGRGCVSKTICYGGGGGWGAEIPSKSGRLPDA